MTREEFRDDLWSWWELYDLCQEIGYSFLDDMMDDKSRDEYIEGELKDAIRNENWRDIRDWLYNIPDGSSGSYWLKDDYGDWIELNDYNFSDYKNQVEGWMDDHGCWDDEEEDAPYEDPDDYGKADAESVTLDALFAASAAVAAEDFLESVADFLTIPA